MTGGAYYNEFEPYAAQWTRNLVAAGHVAPGFVDERSIVDIQPADLDGYTQFHAFCGVSGWSAALRDAGWPDDCEASSASCPCQGFSTAGRKRGFSDERHLWPEYFRIVKERRFPVIYLEQVASPDGLKWLDLVQSDLEGEGYTVAPFDLCAAGLGAPHIRQRLYIVAYADGERLERVRVQLRERRSQQAVLEARWSGAFGELADVSERGRGEGIYSDLAGARRRSSEHGDSLVVGDTGFARGRRNARTVPCTQGQSEKQRLESGHIADEFVAAGTDLVMERIRIGNTGHEYRRLVGVDNERTGAVRGYWSDADWLICRDGKARPVESMSLTMDDGSAGSVGPLCSGVRQRAKRLKGYGNGIVKQVATTFIESVIDVLIGEP